MPLSQEWIHKLEVGGGMRYFRIGLALLAVAMLFVLYNWRAFKNMSTLEAMDAAQLGRNIAEGKGFTTLFVRPFSIYLLMQHNKNKPAKAADPAQIRQMHPDLANPPVYPVVLAGLMKVLPFDYKISTAKPKPFWTYGGRFWRYQPDFLISAFNQFLFLIVIGLVFLLSRQLFDPPVAWLSALLLLGTELFWRFSVSGLSTIFLSLVFMGLVWSVVLLEREVRVQTEGAFRLISLSIIAGLLIGVGGLTRYAFAWLIIPLVLYLLLISERRRLVLALLALLAFAAMMAPWIIRNFHVSGTPFGTASYAILEGTGLFAENRLQRSLDPDFGRLSLGLFWQKLILNSRQIVQGELPKLGGSWVSAFFLVGLLVNVRNDAVRRLRYFLLMCLGVLAVVQAMGRTQLSEESPEINTENLLVLLTPVVMVYGVSLFYLLLDQISVPFRELRYIIVGTFSVAVCLPLILIFLPPKTIPVAYPPYYPPAIQTIAGWMKPEELIMSDVPWALAWYGQRQCVWLTLNPRPDFFTINDYQKPVVALYLTSETMDSRFSRFLSEWVKAGEQTWGSLVLESMLKKEGPAGFPLRKLRPDWLPDQLFLTDWERWRKMQ